MTFAEPYREEVAPTAELILSNPAYSCFSVSRTYYTMADLPLEDMLRSSDPLTLISLSVNHNGCSHYRLLVNQEEMGGRTSELAQEGWEKVESTWMSSVI